MKERLRSLQSRQILSHLLLVLSSRVSCEIAKGGFCKLVAMPSGSQGTQAMKRAGGKPPRSEKGE